MGAHLFTAWQSLLASRRTSVRSTDIPETYSLGGGVVPQQGVEDPMAAPQDRCFDDLYSRYFREVLAFCMRRGNADDA
jgi:hypothetical protein